MCTCGELSWKCIGKCIRGFAKFILIFINAIFLLGGFLMLAFGITITAAPAKVWSSFTINSVNFSQFSQLSNDQLNDIVLACGIFMIILGVIMVVISFFGFFGACCENKCMLVTYAVLLIIIVLAEVALIAFASVFPSQGKVKVCCPTDFIKFLASDSLFVN